MKKEFSDKLHQKYPLLFGNISFECQEGWYFILDSIAQVISPDDVDVVAGQVKEKFGTLRFYYMHPSSEGTGIHPDYSRGAVRMAEWLTYSICEVCGAPGATYSGGWVSTRCSKCAGDRQRGSIREEDHVDHQFGLGLGWSRIISLLSKLIANNVEHNRGPSAIVYAAKIDGRLVVTIAGGRERENGMVALINHFGNRIDEITGEPRQ